MSSGQPIPHGSYHQTGNISDPTLPFRSVYPTRLFSSSSTTLLPHGQLSPQPAYMYSSPSRLIPLPSQYNSHPLMNDYFVGHVVPGNTHSSSPNQPEMSNYTCIGAPVVGHGFTQGNYGNSRGTTEGVGVGGGDSREMSLYNHDEGLNWGRSCTSGTQKHLDPSSINRFQDGF